MKKLKYSFIIFGLAVLLVGCSSVGSWLFPSPSQKQEKAAQKVEQTKETIIKKDEAIIDKGRGYVYGADYALSLNPSNNIYTDTAKTFTSRALVTLGTPEMVEVIQLREIVNNLTSSNKTLIIKGEQQLADKDEEVVKLQSQVKKLEDTLKSKEDKLKQINEENSKYANTWVSIKRIFWWIVWIIGIGFVLSVLGKVLPPPYNTISSLVSIPISFIVRLIHGLIPNIKQLSGVVSQEVHQESEKALKQLVEGIQELKTKKKTTFEEIEPFLKETTDKDVKQTITKKLQELGYI